MKTTRMTLMFLLTGMASLFFAFAAPAQSAPPTPDFTVTGNAIFNKVAPSNYKITVSPKWDMSSPTAIWPGQASTPTVRCFVPALTSHSYWGATYWGGQKRCFGDDNNGYLYLYSGIGWR
jgi:hypothetical protein